MIGQARPPGRPSCFEGLQGWGDFDARACWRAFRASAAAEAAPLRPAAHPGPKLRALLDRAAAEPAALSAAEALAFFADHFTPCALEAPGFLTGYYEPIVDAAWHRSPSFAAPLLVRPPDLVTIGPGDPRSGLPDGFGAGRWGPAGALEVYDDRASIESVALSPSARPLAWLRDWTEVFMIQVQGSARLRFADGVERRLVYAGRNGHPYVSIGRLLIESGRIALEQMSLDVLKAWIREHGQEPGDEGRTLMQRNGSYIFFRLAPTVGVQGPIGGAGLPLTAGVSIATDRAIWPYGLPVWIETDEVVPGFGGPVARLFVSQDTGSAIVGSARADLFLGSGEQAGAAAGSIRHSARFTVLLPRAA